MLKHLSQRETKNIRKESGWHGEDRQNQTAQRERNKDRGVRSLIGIVQKGKIWFIGMRI